MVVINMTCPYKVQMLNAKGYIYLLKTESLDNAILAF